MKLFNKNDIHDISKDMNLTMVISMSGYNPKNSQMNVTIGYNRKKKKNQHDKNQLVLRSKEC